MDKVTKQSKRILKIISIAIIFCLVFEQTGFAQIAGEFNFAGYFSNLQLQPIADKFRPLHLRYLSYDNQTNNFKLLLDKGDFVKGLSLQGTVPEQRIESETKTLLNYFFIGLTLPNDAFWVNLRPDSPDNVIDNELAFTDIGKILLEADVQLKKDTASYTSPQTLEGRKYWNKLYEKAQQLFGYDQITIPTLTRPWIVPGEIIIRESTNNAYIYKATLKVMLEEDYLTGHQDTKSQGHQDYTFKDPRMKALNEYSSQLIRELIIPKITKEVNTSKKYASLRQVYYSLILSQWFKSRASSLRGASKASDEAIYNRIDSHNLNGLASKELWSKTTYFDQYQSSFKNGEYNVQEPVQTPYGQTVRSYFSGGVALGNILAPSVTGNTVVTPNELPAEIARKFLPVEISGRGMIAELSRQNNRGSLLLPRIKGKKTQPVSSPEQEPIELSKFNSAISRLAQRRLSEEELKAALVSLKLNSSGSQEEDYKQIFRQLAQGSGIQVLVNNIGIDIESLNVEDRPRDEEVAIGYQNENPRLQSILEAVANGIDAVIQYIKIGQFGKGIKQILSWLSAGTKDSIDIYTRRKDSAAFHLRIIKAAGGSFYVNVNQISPEEFQEQARESMKYNGGLLEHGTVVAINKEKPIVGKDSQGITLEEISREVGKRFPFITAVSIAVKINGQPWHEINNFDTKDVIVGRKESRGDGKVRLVLNDNQIRIIDNGPGMDEELLLRMFAPKEGDKAARALDEAGVNSELKDRVSLVHDKSLPERGISFARNGEVIAFVGIPQGIIPEAVVEGGLLLELGLLLSTQENRNTIKINQDFTKAIFYIIDKVLSAERSVEAKLKYINTIVVGLDMLTQGNSAYENDVAIMRKEILEKIQPLIEKLAEEGVVILPHNQDFDKLIIPTRKTAIFLHPKIFDASNQKTLEALGAKRVSGITLGAGQRISLLVADFKPESLQYIQKYVAGAWARINKKERSPVIRHDGYCLIPPQLGARLNYLAEEIARGARKETDKEFRGLLQAVNIITAEEVVVSYEVAQPPQNINLSFTEVKAGRRDELPISKFLAQPPEKITPKKNRVSLVPEDARQKYVLLSNGDVIDPGTKEVIILDILELDPLRNGYYRIKFKSSGMDDWRSSYNGLVKIENGKVQAVMEESAKIAPLESLIISPDKRFAYILEQFLPKGQDIKLTFKVKDNCILDLATGKEYFLPDFTETAAPLPSALTYYYQLQFSQDGRFITYLETNATGGDKFFIMDLHNPAQAPVKLDLGIGDYEYALNPFANLAFVKAKNANAMFLIDLERGKLVIGAKYLRTDSLGAYTAVINFLGMMIYHHRTGKLIDQLPNGSVIDNIRTVFREGKEPEVEVIDPVEGTYYVLDNSGHFILAEINKSTYYFLEEVMMNDEIGFNKRIGGQWSPIVRKGVPFLQQLNAPGIYKHPKFNLIIDNSDPDNPRAIDIQSGGEFLYQGQIAHYQRVGQEGHLYFVHNGNPFASVDGKEPKPWLNNPVYDALPAKYLVSLEAERSKPRWELRCMSPRDVDVLSIPVAYTNASYDGKYFVFVDPQTGDTAYLDPEKPKEPIFVSGKTETQDNSAWLDPGASALPATSVIKQAASGEFYLGLAHSVSTNGSLYQRVERLSQREFIGYKADGGVEIISDIGNIQMLSSQEKIISHSGKYVVSETLDGDLTFYDHSTAHPSQITIAHKGEYAEYEVSDKADAVIVKKPSGLYSLYQLGTALERIEDAEYIEINSSGEVIVFKKQGFLFVSSLKSEYYFSAGPLKSVQVAADKEHIYTMTRWGDEGGAVFVHDKNGHLVASADLKTVEQLGKKLPRFWEYYDLTDKKIWDEQKQEFAPALISEYAPATGDSASSISLFGSTVVQRFPATKAKFASLAVTDLETGKMQECSYPSSRKLYSLIGGKVYYFYLDRPAGEVVLTAKEKLVPGKVFVNESKSFLLGEEDNNLWLMDEEGNRKDITGQVPQGFAPTDVNGEYFVFCNPQTGKVKYLDPKQLTETRDATQEETKFEYYIPAPSGPLTNGLTKEAILNQSDDSVVSGVEAIQWIKGDHYLLSSNLGQELVEIKNGRMTVLLSEHSSIGWRIKFSPDKKYAYMQHRDGANGFTVYNLENGRSYVIGDPMMETTQLAFSRSGKFAAYLLQRDAEGPVIYVHYLEKDKSYELIGLNQQEEFSLSQFSDSIVIRKAAGKYRFIVLGVIDNDPPVAFIDNVDYLHTDSTGAYTAIVRNGQMDIYLHKTGKLLNAGDFGWGKTGILMAQTGWQEGKPCFTAVSKDGVKLAFDEDGKISQIFGESEYYEEFYFSGVYSAIYLPVTKKDKFSTIVNPLHPNFYKHPEFGLFIDCFAPGGLEAVDPKTQKRFKFKGQIIGYVLKSPTNFSVLYSVDEGVLYGAMSNGAIDKVGTYSAVSPEHKVALSAQRGVFFLMYNFTIKKISPVELAPDDYRPLYYNGRYFILRHKDTGEIIFVDPQNSDDPIIYPQKAETVSSLEIDERGVRLWKETFYTPDAQTKQDLRAEFIHQAKSAYDELIDEIAPGNFKQDIEDALQPLIEKLYQDQEKELVQRFFDALEKEQKPGLGLSGHEFAFSRFSSRLSILRQALKDYLKSERSALIQEDYNAARKFYVDLFSGAFELMLAPEVSLQKKQANKELFSALAFGWHIDSVEELAAVQQIGEFIRQLKSNATPLAVINKIITILSSTARKNTAENLPIILNQLKKITELKKAARQPYLDEIKKAFKDAQAEEIIRFLAHPEKAQQSGLALEIALFLTQNVDRVKVFQAADLQGKDNILPAPGVSLAVIEAMAKEWLRTHKKAMTITDLASELAKAAKGESRLPIASAMMEESKVKDATAQRERGAYAAEITQNSRDAVKKRGNQDGELVIDWYLRRGSSGKEELVEEAVDNGTGALDEIALIIDKSTKAGNIQISQAGFFGTGKYTIFDDVDSVEIISKNEERCLMFSFTVKKNDLGKPVEIALSRIKELDMRDGRIKTGVIVRRVKDKDGIIPDLEQMLARRAWKDFAGLAQDENFKIYFINRNENNQANPAKQRLEVKYAVLGVIDFVVNEKSLPEDDLRRRKEKGESGPVNFGQLRVISAEDMPLQIVDRAGLRVSQIKDEYLELIPKSLRELKDELGLIIQIPLPLIRNRTAFKDEGVYKNYIQRYVAIAFYQALAYKAFSSRQRQFSFEGFSFDLRSNDDSKYDLDIALDRTPIDLAKRVNEIRRVVSEARFEDLEGIPQISAEELKGLFEDSQAMDLAHKFIKFLILLEFPNPDQPGKFTSLYAERVAYQARARKAEAESIMRRAASVGVRSDTIPDVTRNPYYSAIESQAKNIITGHEQMQHPEDFIFPPEQYEAKHKELLGLAYSIARHFGIEQILLLNDEVSFAGAFGTYQGKKTMFLSSRLAERIGQPGKHNAVLDDAVDTTIHELAHLLEKDAVVNIWQQGLIDPEDHLSGYTHQPRGPFAEAMKHVAEVWLMNYDAPSGSIPQAESPAAGMQAPEDLLKRFRDGDVEAVAKQLNGIKGSGLYDDMMQGLRERLTPQEMETLLMALWKDSPGSASSPSIPDKKTGGIDFRGMPIVTQLSLGTVPLAATLKPLVGTVLMPAVNLDKEWRQIEKMLQAGIRPSTDRIKAYAYTCASSSNNQDIDKVLSCIADILRQEEETCIETEDSLRQMLVLLESDQPFAKLPGLINAITVTPKEPKIKP